MVTRTVKGMTNKIVTGDGRVTGKSMARRILGRGKKQNKRKDKYY